MTMNSGIPLKTRAVARHVLLLALIASPAFAVSDNSQISTNEKTCDRKAEALFILKKNEIGKCPGGENCNPALISEIEAKDRDNLQQSLKSCAEDAELAIKKEIQDERNEQLSEVLGEPQK